MSLDAKVRKEVNIIIGIFILFWHILLFVEPVPTCATTHANLEINMYVCMYCIAAVFLYVYSSSSK